VLVGVVRQLEHGVQRQQHRLHHGQHERAVGRHHDLHRDALAVELQVSMQVRAQELERRGDGGVHGSMVVRGAASYTARMHWQQRTSGRARRAAGTR
jgi:hypothetical protein